MQEGDIDTAHSDWCEQSFTRTCPGQTMYHSGSAYDFGREELKWKKINPDWKQNKTPISEEGQQ